MDPVTLLVIAAAFAGSCIAQKCADATIDAVWDRIRKKLRPHSEQELRPTDFVKTDQLSGDLRADSELQELVNIVFASSTALRRAELAHEALHDARVLWVDDLPENNSWERTLLRAWGIRITSVETDRSAVACLQRESFDLIISDIARRGALNAGIEALPKIRRVTATPLVFYIAQLDPKRGVPKGAFGITNRPDELLHLTLDVLERSRL